MGMNLYTYVGPYAEVFLKKKQDPYDIWGDDLCVVKIDGRTFAYPNSDIDGIRTISTSKYDEKVRNLEIDSADLTESVAKFSAFYAKQLAQVEHRVAYGVLTQWL